jgi:Family of unknown function (DUF6527)
MMAAETWSRSLTRHRVGRPGRNQLEFSHRLIDRRPEIEEVADGEILFERRHGYDKWAYLLCPKCRELISLPLGNPETTWMATIDAEQRITISPSIWQTGSCGAHFLIKKSRFIQCVVVKRKRKRRPGAK